MIAPSRPVLRWHGGKWRLAPWSISHFPPHRIYVEPFGRAASVLLLRKPLVHTDMSNLQALAQRYLERKERRARLEVK